jgi:hypothetical protein
LWGIFETLVHKILTFFLIENQMKVVGADDPSRRKSRRLNLKALQDMQEECRHDERRFTNVKPHLKYKLAGAKLFTSMDIFDERERAAKRLFTGAKLVTTSPD